MSTLKIGIHPTRYYLVLSSLAFDCKELTRKKDGKKGGVFATIKASLLKENQNTSVWKEPYGIKEQVH